jgi:hypothetical protein
MTTRSTALNAREAVARGDVESMDIIVPVPPQYQASPLTLSVPGVCRYGYVESRHPSPSPSQPQAASTEVRGEAVGSVYKGRDQAVQEAKADEQRRGQHGSVPG